MFKTLRRLRRLRRLLLVIPLLLGVLIILVLLWADEAVRKGVTVAGSQILDVPVTIGDLDLTWSSQGLIVRDVSIANPPGFRLPEMIHLDQGRLNARVKAFAEDTVHIRRIHLDGITVNMEQRGGVSNLQKILDRIPKPYEPNYPKTKPLRIDLLEITNVVVRAKLTPLPGEYDMVEFTLAPIRLENIGQKETVDSAILSSKVLLAILNSILEHLGAGTDLLLREADNAMDQIGRFGRGIESLFKGSKEKREE